MKYNCRPTNIRWKVQAGASYMDESGFRRGPMREVQIGDKIFFHGGSVLYDSYGTALFMSAPDLIIGESKCIAK